MSTEKPTGRPPFNDDREHFGIRVRISPVAREALRLESFKTRRSMGLIVGELIEQKYGVAA